MATAAPATMVAHFIKVGQGAAILLDLPCGAVLLDTGGERTQRTPGRRLLRAYVAEFSAPRH